jgi:hypothetical protein
MTHPQCSAVSGTPLQAIVQQAIMAHPHFKGSATLAFGLAGAALKAIPAVPQAVGMREALEDVSNWLEGCLQCKTWSWDGLQRDAAEGALNEARSALALRRQQPDPQAVLSPDWERLAWDWQQRAFRAEKALADAGLALSRPNQPTQRTP